MSQPGTGLGQGCTDLCRPARHAFYCGTGTGEGWHLSGMESSAQEVQCADLLARAIGGVLVTRGSVQDAATAALLALDAAGYTLALRPATAPCAYCAEPVSESMAHKELGEWECHDRPAFDWLRSSKGHESATDPPPDA